MRPSFLGERISHLLTIHVALQIPVFSQHPAGGCVIRMGYFPGSIFGIYNYALASLIPKCVGHGEGDLWENLNAGVTVGTIKT